MTDIYTIIRQAFDGYLVSLLPTLGLTATDVSWYNVTYKPDASRLYIRPRFIKGENRVASLGLAGFMQLTGLYQIDVLGIQNRGIKDMEDMVTNLLDKFRSGSKLIRSEQIVYITNSYSSNPTIDNLRPVIPVTISWSTYNNKETPQEVFI